MSYYCDYNWMPLALPLKFCCDSEKWENFFESTLNNSMRRVCCASEDLLFVMTFDNSTNTYIIENRYGDITKDVFCSSDQIAAENYFLSNVSKIV
jgi:hypothetical protein